MLLYVKEYSVNLPCKLCEPEKVDSVYVYNGITDVFLIFESLSGKENLYILSRDMSILGVRR